MRNSESQNVMQPALFELAKEQGQLDQIEEELVL